MLRHLASLERLGASESRTDANDRIITAATICALVHHYKICLEERQLRALLGGLRLQPDRNSLTCPSYQELLTHFSDFG